MAIEIIKTVAEILKELNQGNPNGPWIELNDLYSFMVVKIENKSVNFYGDRGLTIKTFMNQETAEIKSYAARFLDTAAHELD